jgi:uncharacterized protein (DUF2141 family)
MNLLLLLTALAQDPGAVRLEITNVQSTEGQLLVALFRAEDGYPDEPDKAYRKALVPPVVGTTVWTFDGLPAGTYAAFVVHDENMNQQCDLKWPIPMPKEPVGATRDAKGSFGPPKFKDASFTVGAAATTQRFKLVRL